MPNLARSTFLVDLSSSNTQKPTTQDMKHKTQRFVEKSHPASPLCCAICPVIQGFWTAKIENVSQNHHRDTTRTKKNPDAGFAIWMWPKA